MNYTCRNCERTYKRKSYYEKHILLCDLIHLNKKDKEIKLQELDDTPSMRTLYEMVLELAKKNKDLEEQIQKINKFVNVKKKSISIVDWLNLNFNNNDNKNYDFYEFISDINIRDKHLEYIFNSNYVKGVSAIIEELFDNDNDNDNDNDIPFKAFDQKENQLFIYVNKMWTQMTNNNLRDFINTISKQIMKLFIKWQNNNIHRLSNEEYSIQYTKNVQKVMGGNLSNYEINNKLKNKLYKYLKVNIKNIIEIDIN